MSTSLLCSYTDPELPHTECDFKSCACQCHVLTSEEYNQAEIPETLSGSEIRLMWLSEIFVSHPDLTLLGGCSSDEPFHSACTSHYLDAFIGVGTRINLEVAIYDSSKVIDLVRSEILKDGTAENFEDAQQMAVDHFEFNIAGSYIGDTTPIFTQTVEEYQ